MKKYNSHRRGAVLTALSLATALAACKTTEEKELEEAGDLTGQWKVYGDIDPESIPEPPTTAMTGTEFLESNKTEEGVVILPSGLQYREMVEGNGNMPGLEDSVLVHYEMKNINGEVLDNSREYDGGKPQSFRVAKVIGGWREALMRMREGARWRLYVPPDLGYGSTGLLGVGANETLVYDIELFKVISTGPSASPDLGGSGDVSLDPLASQP